MTHFDGPRGPRQIGERQASILRRAAASDSGQVMVDWRNNREVCAVKRLATRGLLVKEEFGGGPFKIVVYTITDAGRAKLAEAVHKGWIKEVTC